MTYLLILPHLPHLTKQMNLKLLITVLAVTALSFALQFWQSQFNYIREAVSQGEVWRIATSQLVHTNWPHYLLNISSVWLFAFLFYTTINFKTFTINLFLLIIAVGICIHLFEPSMFKYAGLSGALYGLYLIGAYSAIKDNDYLVGIGTATLIIGKVCFDHWFGPFQDNSALIEARVATEAHVYGVCAALLLICSDALIQYIKAKASSQQIPD